MLLGEVIMEKVIFRNKLAIGDNLVFTIALRELQKKYPNKYQTGIISFYPEVYENNTNITIFSKEEAQNIKIIDVDYHHEFVNRKVSGKHFAQGYITCLNNLFNLNIDLTDCRPDIFITDEENIRALDILGENNIKDKFWLLSPGFKQDMPLKNYSAFQWQKFINEMEYNDIQIVQTGDKVAINPRFKNVKSLVGELNLREYFAVASLSNGMIGYPSLQMHLAAGLRKPCIVVAGSREGISWNSYDNQHYLHSVGLLNCCQLYACWKKDIQYCTNYDYKSGIARCMQLIDVKQIIDIVMKYENIN